MFVDESVFSLDAIAPEVREFNDELERLLAEAPDITRLPPQDVRDARERGESIFGPIRLSDRAADRYISGPSSRIRLRVHVSEGARGVYLHIHGGGWVLGAAHHRDLMLDRLADAASVTVVSVDYRLAPEHPYPAGPDDCELTALWLVENCVAEFGTDRLVIGGESAGAHLAVVTLLRLRDRHGDPGFRGANLAYGAYDLSGTPTAANWGKRNLILSEPIIRWFADHFVPAELRREPDVSPLYADLQGLPPALFTVGTLDPLLDDTLFMAQRWIAAGNETDLALYAGGVHAFDYFEEHPLAEGALERTHRFIQSRTE
ncbi:MAG: alpha/beta hydrolase [Acidimicrobiia bacterium]